MSNKQESIHEEKAKAAETFLDFRDRMEIEARENRRGLIAYVLEDGKEYRPEYDVADKCDVAYQHNVTCKYRTVVDD